MTPHHRLVVQVLLAALLVVLVLAVLSLPL
jgi:hypothetical protein